MQWVKYEIEEHFFLNVTRKFMKFHPVNQTAIKNHFDICQEASEKLLIQCIKIIQMVQKTRGAHESNALCDIMIYENIKYC